MLRHQYVICAFSVYLEVNEHDQALAQFHFTFTGSGLRKWEVKVSQISCQDENRAPSGCLQYLRGHQGKMKTFNYDNSQLGINLSQRHLANQMYSSCVRYVFKLHMHSVFICVTL